MVSASTVSVPSAVRTSIRWLSRSRPEPSMIRTPCFSRPSRISLDWLRARLRRRWLMCLRSACITGTKSPPSTSNFTPSSPASATRVIRSAVAMRVLEGTTSVSTAEPPSPARSITVTVAPSEAATMAASYPPGPPPRIAIRGELKSGCVVTVIHSLPLTARPPRNQVAFRACRDRGNRGGRITCTGEYNRLPEHRPVRRRPRRRGLHRGRNGRGPPRHRPGPWLRVGRSRRPDRRDHRHPVSRGSPRLPRPGRGGPCGHHPFHPDEGRKTGTGPGRPHALLRGQGRPRRGARYPHRSRRRVQHPGPDQRLRRPQRGLDARHAGPDP